MPMLSKVLKICMLSSIIYEDTLNRNCWLLKDSAMLPEVLFRRQML